MFQTKFKMFRILINVNNQLRCPRIVIHPNAEHVLLSHLMPTTEKIVTSLRAPTSMGAAMLNAAESPLS